MSFAWLKRWMPRSLYGRAALILLVPVVVIQLVVSVVFIQRHFEGVTRQMSQSVALELRYLVAAVDGAPDLASASSLAEAIAGPLDFEVALPGGETVVDSRLFYDISGRSVDAALREDLPGLQAIDLGSSTRTVTLRLATAKGPIEVSFPRRRVSASNPHQLLVLMVGTSALMTLIAFLFLRNQLRPIRRLADAATAFGKGRHDSYSPSGATEVRLAGQAFLDMRARIERQMEQRTLMLSGVSHDLRTPLTRMKLALSLMDDTPERAALESDVADMERLIGEFLAFARGDALDDLAEVDLAGFTEAVVDGARRAGRNVSLAEVSGSGRVRLRPMAIGRALDNLIGNAVRYGTRCEVSAGLTDKTVRLTVEDDGPGIPELQREEALKPFARLDRSRNLDSGSGAGLGLSIASDIARRHGGRLQLGTSGRLGGLKAELILAR